MIKYTIEQKVALVRKFELYRLDLGLSGAKAAKLVHAIGATLKSWDKLDALPGARYCYQMEKIMLNFTPTNRIDILSADSIAKDVEVAKRKLLERNEEYRQHEAKKNLTQ